MSFRILTKLTVPVAFFGYAIFANVALFNGAVERPAFEGFLKGGFTQQVDTLYRANLPHREPAVGWVGAARYILLNEGRAGVVAGKNGWLFSSEEFRSQDDEHMALDRTLDWIKSVQSTLAESGSNLIIVPLPAKLDIARDHSTSLEQVRSVEATYDLFLAELVANGIDVVDNKANLLAHSGAFFRTDTHWTMKGAEAVAAAVAQSGLIAHGSDTFTRSEQEAILFSGDLVSFVTSEEIAPAIGLELEVVTPFIAEMTVEMDDLGGIDLFGSDGPMPIALVGTSYSANPHWSFAEALKLALHQDVLNYAEQGRGPIAPMKAFLDGVDPDQAPPFVIWEFPVRYLSDPKLLDILLENEGGDNA